MIPAEAFADIQKELLRRPLPMNLYRKKVADGRSNVFGVVNRRSLPCDYSRLCWGRPYLYKLLLDFAEQYVKIPWTSITVNENYLAGPHQDRHNIGDSLLVGFGDYTGGELKVHTENHPLSGLHDIKFKPLVMNFTEHTHSVLPFTGNRFSLVFYTIDSFKLTPLPPASVKIEGEKYVFYRGDERISDGLPHPLKNRKKPPKTQNKGLQIVQTNTIVSFD
jgi:hypothetical protein